MYTEDEAREKLCPQIKASYFHAAECKCIASQCMAWRWGDELNRQNFYAWASAMSDRKTPEEASGKPVARGYCGLAGRPE